MFVFLKSPKKRPLVLIPTSRRGLVSQTVSIESFPAWKNQQQLRNTVNKYWRYTERHVVATMGDKADLGTKWIRLTGPMSTVGFLDAEEDVSLEVYKSTSSTAAVHNQHLVVFKPSFIVWLDSRCEAAHVTSFSFWILSDIGNKVAWLYEGEQQSV